ncbi:gamma-glutamylcyclotransferase [Wenzhouxiangella sp. AB-CW3]|uniref:gamma-glutamylcyclotransferase n=1 Tax=Wenzhouxiangella sp. AB-CW3 TaxID=2771012 RepID=UPI00168BA1CB|nr:gamma-glutamylcyclotransferase [Wenzhouxiangella sp. AB-CW3]QOC21340.1 gamma-glutamylcyclotransferase [Wenzhouxiangella sp. AB-CW3]
MTNDSRHWVFGYGSLIYKVDFPYVRRSMASIRGWERRFWQGSHDHRGTPESPGRVLTLVPSSPDQVCLGMAYLIEHEVFEHLDHREKNGYERRKVRIRLHDADATVGGLTYFAGRNNPAWLGPADIADIARHINHSHGPSGSNRDYLLDLARSLRGLGADDTHVFELERKVLALGNC